MLFIAQMVVVGVYGGRAMCFGSVHAMYNEIETQVTGCEHDHSHDHRHGVPLIESHAVPHDDGCGCVDVSVEEIELIKPFTDSESLDHCTGAFAQPILLSVVGESLITRAWGPPRCSRGDPDNDAGLLIAGTSRLLL